MANLVEIALIVEDELSRVVMERVLAATGREYKVKSLFVERGFGNIRRSVAKYRNASNWLPHVVLTDLDQAECAPTLRLQWGLTHLPKSMLFRVAVRETEAWLLADRNGFAAFAGIAINKVTLHPENLADPKQALVNLVRRSRNRRLAAELVPAAGSPMSSGPLYNERLGSFARATWDVNAASAAAPSLRRTLERLQTFLT